MKIISLHFKNLNSLKGEFKIDFSKPELANAGLFAITGPTGAGKSTILDAITLALYSYTPRLGDITDTTIPEKGVIVTKHTREAFSHIEFEVSGQKYKAEWAAAKNSNNNWKKLVHLLSIYEVNQFVTIKSKITEKIAEVYRITGLTKDQFTKAIVLSQGKFDEFLKKGETKERYKLLEIITGTSIYRKIGQKIFETLKFKNTEVDDLEKQIDGISRLTTEELTAFQQKKLSLSNEVNDLKEEFDQLNNLKQAKENITRCINERTKIEDDLLVLQEKISEFRPFLKKLEEHEKALPLQVDYNNWLNTDIEIKNLDTQIIDLNGQLGDISKEKENLKNGLSQLLKVKVDEVDFENQLNIFVDKVYSIDQEIKKINTALEQKKEGLNILFKQIPTINAAIIKPFVKSIDQLNDFVNARDLELNVNPLPTNIDTDKIGEEVDALNNKSLLCKDAVNQKTEVERLKVLKLSQQDSLDEKKQMLALQEIEIEKLEISIESKTKAIGIVQKAYDANLAYMSLDLHRTKLVEGEACPCCGSLEHPYVKTKPRADDEIAGQLQQLKDELALVLKEDRSIRDLTVANKSAIDSLIAVLEETNNRLDSQTVLYTGTLNKLQLADDTTVDILNNQCNEIVNTIQNLKAHKLWNETKYPLMAYISSLNKYNDDEGTLNELTKTRNGLFEDTSILEFKSNQQLRWSNVNKEISSKSQLLSETKLSKEKKNKSYQALDDKLKTSIAALSFESIDVLGSVLLSDSDLDKYRNEKGVLENEGVSLKTRKNKVEEQYNLEMTRDNPSIIYEELLNLINEKTNLRDGKNTEIGAINSIIKADEDNQLKFASIENKLQDLNVERGYYQTLAELIGDKDGDKFNNIIQRITLRHLFKMTNDRLAIIMDRYQIDLGSEKQEDEIWVIDTYMGDERRVIDSVSGGERFVISLALALSLSDLASNNVKLDSVFIDEGFGSLSPEELDNAISMLERLQVENEKTIGIISHVESLKERISTQIVIQKLQNGESAISLKSNGKLTSLAIT